MSKRGGWCGVCVPGALGLWCKDEKQGRGVRFAWGLGARCVFMVQGRGVS